MTGETDAFERHHRRSVRLAGYDYSQNGAYFLTLCVHERECLFGEIDDQGNMVLNDFGKIVQAEWMQTPVVRTYVVLDEFVVMPNHFHAIIILTDDPNKPNPSKRHTNSGVGATCQVAPTKPAGAKSGSIGAIIGQFKRKATIAINEQRDTPGAPVWQRNYYEHVIRNESSLNDIRSYIQANPTRWAEDRENPGNPRR